MVVVPFQRRRDVWRDGGFPIPWAEGRRAIFDHLSSGAIGTLPDEDEVRGDGGLGWVPGARDNVLHRHEGQVAPVVAKLRAVLRQPDATRLRALYDVLMAEGVIGVVDEAIVALCADPPPMDRLETLCLWLARASPDREVVKFAIAMLGLVPGGRHRELFLLLGAHEEFTKFAAVALQTTLSEASGQAALTELAKTVDGWGRIDLVERLAPDGDAEFRHWLVRGGFRNTIMNQYLALIAARDGDLLGQLHAPGAGKDMALIDGAADIFAALSPGGPARDMRDYDDGVAAVERWFALVAEAPVRLAHGPAIRRLRRMAKQTPPIWGADDAARILALIAAYLRRPDLRDGVKAALAGDDKRTWWRAANLAPMLRLDVWPHAFARQARDPSGHYWPALMGTPDPARIDRTIALFRDQVPLEAIATGPADELGLGQTWRAHAVLDVIVQELRRFPGQGWPLIAASLRSPVVRNRNMAVRALSKWRLSDWPADALPLVRQAIRDEPRDDVRAGLEDLLRPTSERA